MQWQRCMRSVLYLMFGSIRRVGAIGTINRDNDSLSNPPMLLPCLTTFHSDEAVWMQGC